MFQGTKRYARGRKRPAMEAPEEEDGGPEGPNRERSGAGATFQCNICLETAQEAVVSVCGHLYCWLCLHQWLETRPERQECPVCKAGISRENVVPLYGLGSQKPQDPRLKTPPCPQGQRPAPESRGGFQPFGNTGSFHFSFGVGAFPFGFFTTVFNTHEPFHRGTRVDLGQGQPGLQLAGLPLPVSHHLLILVAQYLSRVSFLPTISQSRISIGGPC